MGRIDLQGRLQIWEDRLPRPSAGGQCPLTRGVGGECLRHVGDRQSPFRGRGGLDLQVPGVHDDGWPEDARRATAGDRRVALLLWRRQERRDSIFRALNLFKPQGTRPSHENLPQFQFSWPHPVSERRQGAYHDLLLQQRRNSLLSRANRLSMRAFCAASVADLFTS